MSTFYFNYTSKSRFKRFNTFIDDFLWKFIPLFNNGFFQRIEISYPSVSVYILLQEFPDRKIYWIQIWTIWWSMMRLH